MVATDKGHPIFLVLDCRPGGQVCSNDVNPVDGLAYCYHGDVHGTNVADWAWAVAHSLGMSETAAQSTLSSSPCMGGMQDNFYEFWGSFRSD